jgi:hypothetical protein
MVTTTPSGLSQVEAAGTVTTRLHAKGSNRCNTIVLPRVATDQPSSGAEQRIEYDNQR